MAEEEKAKKISVECFLCDNNGKNREKIDIVPLRMGRKDTLGEQKTKR